MPRWNSTIGLVLFVIIGGALIGVLAAHRGVLESLFATGVCWLFALGALWGAYAFGRWVLWPPLALAATEPGLITFSRLTEPTTGSWGSWSPGPTLRRFPMKPT